MKFRLNILLALIAAGVAFSAATAQAAIVGGLNNIQYADREVFATYSDATHTYTTIDTSVTAPVVGDHLYGVSVSTAELPDASNNPDARGIFDLVIAHIITAGGVDGLPAGYTGTAEYLLTSDNTTGGFLTGSSATTYTLGDGSTVTGLGAATNTMDVVYQGSLSQFNATNLDTGKQGDVINAATNSTLYGDFGYGKTLTSASAISNWGASGVGYWVADVTYVGGTPVSGTSPFVLGLVPTSGLSAAGYVGLYNQLTDLQQGGEKSGNDGTSIYMNAGTAPLTPDTLAGTVAYGGAGTTIPNPNTDTFTLVGGGHSSVLTGSPWNFQSSDPFWVDPVAPEPGTMLMMGMGLVFGAGYLRRRQKAA
jgi:hypothetical protein